MKDFRQGIRDGIPICLGYFSVAFAFGIFAVSSGLDAWQAIMISALNVTSAGQLAAVPIMAGGGAFLEMAASQLLINLRYSLMSISLSQKLDKSMTIPHRITTSFVMTDEVFAVASMRNSVSRPYMYGLIITPWFGWTVGTAVGAFAGDILPAVVTASLGIAIYGMFVAIVLPVAKHHVPTMFCALVAIALSCAFRYLPAFSKVSGGFAIIICAVFASALAAIIKPIPQPCEEDE